MPTLHILRGVPASGKSTYARLYAQEHDAIRINRDDIRMSMFGRLHNVDEELVTKVQAVQLAGAFTSGQDILLDNTNLRASTVRDASEQAARHGYDVSISDFPISFDLAVERDGARATPVGAEVIKGFFERYHIHKEKGTLPKAPISVDQNPGYSAEQYVPDTSKPTAFGIDLDGTLAQMTGRGPYDTSLYHTDAPDPAVREIVQSLFDANHRIIVFTGRSEDFRDVCEQWLADHNIPFHLLVMRPSGDSRNDAIVKAELFDRHIAPNFNFLAQFDDRNRVVDMFRSRGIKCLQAQPGDF